MSLIAAPTFMTAGTGAFDAGTAEAKDIESNEKKGIIQGIEPLWSLEENYQKLLSTVAKFYARKKGVDHGNSHLQMDGYMTAWFRYYLTDDVEAGKAFWGAGSEIKQNPNYKDVVASK